MSQFPEFEPIFKKTYVYLLKYFKLNLIDVLDESPWMRRLSWLQFVVSVLAVASHTGGVLDSMADGADLVKLSSDLSATLVIWQAALICVQIQGNRKLIRNFILHLGSEWRWDSDLRPDMVTIKKDTIETAHIWITRFYKVLTVYMHLYLCVPLLFQTVNHFVLEAETPFTTSFKFKIPFEYENNFLLFFILYMADYVVLFQTGFIITSDLLLMIVSMNHLRILFVMLQDDIKRIAISADDPFKEISRSKLKQIIPKHGTLLHLMEELSEAFGAIFLIHLAFFSGTMCFFGFAARVHCSPESIKNLLATSFILICIYSCCSYGQDLTDAVSCESTVIILAAISLIVCASLDIANAAYESPWSDSSREFKMCILLIMIRAQKTYYIQSTSFAEISLRSFTKILNVTWSFLSLIDKVYEE